jgi:hypothetical protein
MTKKKMRRKYRDRRGEKEEKMCRKGDCKPSRKCIINSLID